VRIEALRRVLQELLPRETVPGLAVRINNAIRLAHNDNNNSSSKPAPMQPTWRAMAASIALAAMVSSGGTWLALHQPAADPYVEAAIAGHMRALMAPQPVDVPSSDRHTVKPWFNGRIPQAPRVVDLAQDGFPLVGGRIDVVERQAIPTLVYRHRQHLISLTATPNPKPGWAARKARTVQGYNLVGWIADGTAYWAVSDLGLGDLEEFARLFRETSAEP
jgi:anti-sigma factor RsiW